MGSYRAVVQYHFKKGMEEQGIRYLENELFKKAQSLGCHHIELLKDEKDHSFFIAIAEWNHFDEAKRFQSHFEKIEKELMRFCSSTPTRHFCKVHFEHVEKTKKVA